MPYKNREIRNLYHKLYERVMRALASKKADSTTVPGEKTLVKDEGQRLKKGQRYLTKDEERLLFDDDSWTPLNGSNSDDMLSGDR